MDANFFLLLEPGTVSAAVYSPALTAARAAGTGGRLFAVVPAAGDAFARPLALEAARSTLDLPAALGGSAVGRVSFSSAAPAEFSSAAMPLGRSLASAVVPLRESVWAGGLAVVSGQAAVPLVCLASASGRVVGVLATAADVGLAAAFAPSLRGLPQAAVVLDAMSAGRLVSTSGGSSPASAAPLWLHVAAWPVLPQSRQAAGVSEFWSASAPLGRLAGGAVAVLNADAAAAARENAFGASVLGLGLLTAATPYVPGRASALVSIDSAAAATALGLARLSAAAPNNSILAAAAAARAFGSAAAPLPSLGWGSPYIPGRLSAAVPLGLDLGGFAATKLFAPAAVLLPADLAGLATATSAGRAVVTLPAELRATVRALPIGIVVETGLRLAAYPTTSVGFGHAVLSLDASAAGQARLVFPLYAAAGGLEWAAAGSASGKSSARAAADLAAYAAGHAAGTLTGKAAVPLASDFAAAGVPNLNLAAALILDEQLAARLRQTVAGPLSFPVIVLSSAVFGSSVIA